MALSTLTRELSSRANAVRTSVGTARFQPAIAALQEKVQQAIQIVRGGQPSGVSTADWGRLKTTLTQAQHTLDAEVAGGGSATDQAENWSDILAARMHAVRTNQTESTLGALMEAIERAGQVNTASISTIARDELVDQLEAARELSQTVIRESGIQTRTDRSASGDPTGLARRTVLGDLQRALWPVDKPIYFRPGFLLGSAIGLGVLVSWKKDDLKRVTKKLRSRKGKK